jgi:hypothetical protein
MQYRRGWIALFFHLSFAAPPITHAFHLPAVTLGGGSSFLQA